MDRRAAKAIKRRPGITKRTGPRGTRYVVMVSLPGQSRREYGGTHRSLEAAIAAYDRVCAEGTANRFTKRTVKDFADGWLDEYPRPRASSNENHQSASRAFVAEFGDWRLDRLPRGEVRAWGRKCTQNALSSARAMLSDAVESDLLAVNHLKDLGRKQSQGRAGIRILKLDEVKALAKTAEEVHGYYGGTSRAIIWWQAMTCMRPAETCALQWEDLEPEDHVVHVRHARARKGGGIHSPKNHKARSIVMPEPAIRALRRMTPQESPWVFLSKTGRPLSYQTMYSDWARVRAAHAAKTGDKHFLTMDLYDLRHFGATTLLNLLEVGEAAVAWQLGHTGSTGTELVLKLYGHPDQKRYMQQIKDAYKRLDP